MGTEIVPKTEEAVPAEAPSEIEQQIIRQIEYYFGNYNLSRDKFLRQQLNVDDGWVPLETLVKFNRLKKLSEDFNVIIEALKKSTKNIMEISEDSTKIRRRDPAPLPEEYSKRAAELDKQTLYVKGFKKNITMDDLLDFFKEHNVQNVYMRRYLQQNNKPFKGSVFVTFETKEDAEKFIETKGIKFKGTELLKEWKVDYVKRKDEEFKQLKAEKEKKMLKKAEMLKEENGEKAPEIDMVTGCLLKLTNLGGNIIREHIKAVFEPYGNVVFIDYSKGKPLAVLRFDTGIASSVYEKLTEEDGEKKVEIGLCKAVVSLIEGAEEEEYWKNIAIGRAQSRQRMKEFKAQRNSGNKGRFKKWGNKRQRGKEGDGEKDDESAERPQKKIRTEDPKDNSESADMEVNSEAPEVKKDVSEVKNEAKKDVSEVKNEAKKDTSEVKDEAPAEC